MLAAFPRLSFAQLWVLLMCWFYLEIRQFLRIPSDFLRYHHCCWWILKRKCALTENPYWLMSSQASYYCWLGPYRKAPGEESQENSIFTKPFKAESTTAQEQWPAGSKNQQFPLRKIHLSASWDFPERLSWLLSLVTDEVRFDYLPFTSVQ